MRRALLLLSFSLSLGCAPEVAAYAPGVRGPALAGTLAVHVQTERGARPIAGASVDVGLAPVTTDANGDATLTTTTSSVTLRVSASGFVTERWIGVDLASASVALAEPSAPRTLTGAISGGSGDMVVTAMTTLSMLRATPVTGSASACAGGACEATLTIATDAAEVDVALVDASSARLVSGVVLGADGRFAIDASAPAASVGLMTLEVTLPAAPGLEGVVGVPGVSSPAGVVLFPAFAATTTTSRSAPAREGPFALGRLWYVVRAENADGSGESVILDRDVGTDALVSLPDAFLAIPSATASGALGIDVDPEADLYVVEAHAGALAERVLVLHPSGAHLEVPIALAGASVVTVRALDTTAFGVGIDLAAAERGVTRFATLEL